MRRDIVATETPARAAPAVMEASGATAQKRRRSRQSGEGIVAIPERSIATFSGDFQRPCHHRRSKALEDETMTAATSRNLPWRSGTTVLVIASAAVFLVMGARALVVPAAQSAFFGIPIESGDGLAFVQAYGARNIGLALTALALVALDMRRGLAALFAAASIIAVCDFAIVSSAAGFAPAAKHLGYVAALALAAILIARRR